MSTTLRSLRRAIPVIAPLCLVGSGIGAAAPSMAQLSAGPTTLIIGSNWEPDTLNPLATIEYDDTVNPAIFDSLVTTDPQGRLVPDLATSVDHSADGRTWTFHLRHGVRWSDGQPFTSADVAYNYQALFAKGHNSTPVPAWSIIDRSSTPDAFTFVCHLKQVFAPFLSQVGTTQLLPKHIYDRPGVDFNTTPFNRTPVGTGPYMVQEWVAGDHLTLVPNPYSWSGQPFFQKIIWQLIPDPNTQLVQLQTGDVDMGLVNESLVSQARAIPGKHLVPYLDGTVFRVDFKQWGFLRETAVRQALDYATPKNAIFRGILHGLGAVAYSDASPLIPNYYNPNLPKHNFDPAKAAALLKADGFVKGADGVLRKGGVPLAIDLWAQTSNSDGQRINEILQHVWGQIGVKVTLHVAGDDVVFGPSGPTFSKAMTAITNGQTNGSDPDDLCFWNSRFIPTSPTGAGCNTDPYFHHFSFQQQIDELTNAGVATIDPAKRRPIYFKIQSLLADQVPAIFLYWESAEMLVPNTLLHYAPNAFSSALWNVVAWRSS